MFVLLIVFIVCLACMTGILFYFNNIARFHRIHLYGPPALQGNRAMHARPVVFNLRSGFEKKDDRMLLELLSVRRLPVVACLGDSITHGIISTNYVELLQKKYKGKYIFVNSGINGNLAYNLNARLDADCISLDPDFVTILIGTNDVYSFMNRKALAIYMRVQELPQVPDRAFFTEHLAAIIRRIRRETAAKIALLSLPVIDENPDSGINARTKEYSEEIKRIAAEEGAVYLPLNETQRDFLARNEAGPPKEFVKRLILTILLMLGRNFDRIAEINGRRLTYDGLHQTSTGADMIGSLISNFLDNSKQG